MTMASSAQSNLVALITKGRIMEIVGPLAMPVNPDAVSRRAALASVAVRADRWASAARPPGAT
jgi:hypothetical protein